MAYGIFTYIKRSSFMVNESVHYTNPKRETSIPRVCYLLCENNLGIIPNFDATCKYTSTWQFFVTFLGWLSDPFKGES